MAVPDRKTLFGESIPNRFIRPASGPVETTGVFRAVKEVELRISLGQATTEDLDILLQASNQVEIYRAKHPQDSKP